MSGPRGARERDGRQLDHASPVPLDVDKSLSRLAGAWRRADLGPPVRSFVPVAG